MPIEFIYIFVVFVVVILGFSVLKRPLYECMLIAFFVLLMVTNTWRNVGSYIWDALKESSLYVIIVFIISANLLSKTSVIDDCIAIILAVFGRFRGGAGYVAIIGSTYMGSLSGSGPGNVATTGVFSIPAMKNSGFPGYLAANVEAHASTMGNMIPPAGMIAIAFNILDLLYPDTYTMSQYWMVLWGIAFWFILQRVITLYIMCLCFDVRSMKREDIPNIMQTVKKGWKAIFLPAIVFLPFFLDTRYKAFFEVRLGDGTSAFSNSILLFIPALIVISAVLLSEKECRKTFTVKMIYDEICRGMVKVVPTAALVMFAYFVSNVLEDLNVGVAIGKYIFELDINLVLLVFLVPLFTAMLGMLIPGSTQIKIFGGTIISVLAATGVNPLLVAAMLPCICGAMHGVTPPYATCLYVAMGIADSDLKQTITNCLIWISIHYLLSVVILLGLIPVWGI